MNEYCGNDEWCCVMEQSSIHFFVLEICIQLGASFFSELALASSVAQHWLMEYMFSVQTKNNTEYSWEQEERASYKICQVARKSTFNVSDINLHVLHGVLILWMNFLLFNPVGIVIIWFAPIYLSTIFVFNLCWILSGCDEYIFADVYSFGITIYFSSNFLCCVDEVTSHPQSITFILKPILLSFLSMKWTKLSWSAFIVPSPWNTRCKHS